MEIKLPDGSSRQLPDGANAFDLANDIGKNLAKSAVAAWINGSQKDLLDPLISLLLYFYHFLFDQ